MLLSHVPMLARCDRDHGTGVWVGLGGAISVPITSCVGVTHSASGYWASEPGGGV